MLAAIIITIIISWVAVVGVVVWEDVAFKAEVDRDEMAVDADREDITARHDKRQEDGEEGK